MNRIVCTVVMVILAILLASCGKPKEEHGPGDGHDHGKEAEHAGDHAAKHGGLLIELAGGRAHLEAVHDESAGRVTLHVMDGAMKPTTLDEAPVLNLTTKEGPKQLKGAAVAGSSSQWTFDDPALKGHPENARLRIVMGGVTYSPELPHEHH